MSKTSNLLYIRNPNCGWCKRADPVVDSLKEDGYDITILNVTDPDDAKRASEIQTKYNTRCGTPLFIDSKTGNMVCGFREKDVLEKWANGEEIPSPPAPAAPAAPEQKEFKKMKRSVKLEYVWLDGNSPTNLRSKTKYEMFEFGEQESPAGLDEIFAQIPEWSFDGSSTNQAETESSDLLIRPVRMYPNPLENSREIVSYIVLFEFFDTYGSPHKTNTRYQLREYLHNLEEDPELFVGVEQEYLIMDVLSDWPSAWGWDSEENKGKFPNEKDSYYCGVGAKSVNHKWLADTHASMCQRVNIKYGGSNAEVLKSQWEYQVGPTDPLSCADSLWLSRYILQRIAESRGLGINYQPKPIEGDWNGSGAHINFSTNTMRESGDKEYFDLVCETLKENHKKDMKSYGDDNNKKRLTGKNETSKHDKFTYGESDRSVSVRIPISTVRNWKGHVEDRRPSADMDPYQAFFALSKTLSKVEDKVLV